MITAFREGPPHKICRNSSFFQKFHEDILGEVNYFETDGTDSMNSDKDDAFIEDAIKENAVSDNTVEQESDDAKQSPTAKST